MKYTTKDNQSWPKIFRI